MDITPRDPSEVKALGIGQRNTVAMPLSTTSAFFRVHADILGGGTN